MRKKNTKLSQVCDGFRKDIFSPSELIKYLQEHPEERLVYLEFLNFCKRSDIYPRIKKQRIDF